MNEILPVIEPHHFAKKDFIGGEASLDFLNTVTGRDAKPRDWLDSYARLLEWAAGAKLLPPKSLHALAQRAERDPGAAERALAKAKRLREALFEIASGIAARRTPSPEALERLREHWLAGAESHDFAVERGRVAAVLDPHADGLDLVASMVAWRFVGQVLPHPRGRLKICSGPDCSWLFLDTSKAGRRRWCDMAVCGNAAKSRRHYARARARH
jgi:predicted RNA-binding Zn ribbon-like protein